VEKIKSPVRTREERKVKGSIKRKEMKNGKK
jgi:hypothetical protein